MDRIDRRTVLGGLGAAATFLLAGCSGDSGDEDEEGLRITNPGFATARVRGYRNYRVQPEDTYFRGKTVYLYFEVKGQETREGNEFPDRFDLTEEMIVTDPNGETIVDRSINLNENYPSDASLEQFYFTNDFDLPEDSSPGEYTIDLTVRDELAGETATRSATFGVKEGDPQES